MREDETLDLIDLGPASEVTQGVEERFAHEELMGIDYRETP